MFLELAAAARTAGSCQGHLPWGQPRRSTLRGGERFGVCQEHYSEILGYFLSPHCEHCVGGGQWGWGSFASAGRALVMAPGSDAAVSTGSSPTGGVRCLCVCLCQRGCARRGPVRQESLPSPSEDAGDAGQGRLRPSGGQAALCWSCPCLPVSVS